MKTVSFNHLNRYNIIVFTAQIIIYFGYIIDGISINNQLFGAVNKNAKIVNLETNEVVNSISFGKTDSR